MLLHSFKEELETSHVETNVYLSDDCAQVIISQCLYKGPEVLSFNEISIPISDFAVCATSVSRTYVRTFLDQYTIDP